MTTSFCAAQWLDVNRYFNTTQEAFNQNTSVQMFPPSFASPSDNHETVEFVSDDLIGDTDIILRVIDMHGNLSSYSFDLSISHLLPPGLRLQYWIQI